MNEQAVAFECAGDTLQGVVHPAAGRTGVLVVVGGPQYRVGSHRQFVLLARRLADGGIPAMRFDYRGMGDSDGESRDFRAVDDDIRSAVDAFRAAQPQLEGVVLWGLCDAASAVLMYAHADARVCAVAVLNPWVRTEASEAKTYLKSYYTRQLLDRAFWRRLFTGKVDWRASAKSLAGFARRAVRPAAASAPSAAADQRAGTGYVGCMVAGLERFAGPVLLVLSGEDLTAAEFENLVADSARWKRLLADPRVTTRRLPSSDHTFSRKEWKDQVADWTADWVTQL